MAEKIRLQKFLSQSGVASRRAAEDLISRNKVKVNGHPVSLGDKVDPVKDIVTVSGKRVAYQTSFIYLALNKPRGYVTTLSDEKDRKCVKDLVSDIDQRIYPIGRLDKDSEGLILMTNDGEFANMIMHPSNAINKTYTVTVSPRADEEQLLNLSTGVDIEGRKTAPAQVTVLEERDDRSLLRIVIHEGRNRQIRKMCEVVGLEVLRLKRISEGAVALEGLKPGQYRPLKKEEIAAMKRLATRQARDK